MSPWARAGAEAPVTAPSAPSSKRLLPWPCRLGLATRRSLTGSLPVADRYHRGCGLSRVRRRVLPTITATAGGSIQLPVPPPHGIRSRRSGPREACFLQALAERGHEVRRGSGRRAAEKPDHRHRWLRARAASGHPAATPPSSVMNSRRLMPIMGFDLSRVAATQPRKLGTREAAPGCLVTTGPERNAHENTGRRRISREFGTGRRRPTQLRRPLPVQSRRRSRVRRSLARGTMMWSIVEIQPS